MGGIGFFGEGGVGLFEEGDQFGDGDDGDGGAAAVLESGGAEQEFAHDARLGEMGDVLQSSERLLVIASGDILGGEAG